MIWDGIERRRFVRVKVSFRTDIYDDKEATISTSAEDISEVGIRVAIKEGLKVSSLVDLEIYLTEAPLICKGKVIWTKKVEAEYLKDKVIFDTGIEFQDLKEEDRLTIKHLVDSQKQKRE